MCVISYFKSMGKPPVTFTKYHIDLVSNSLVSKIVPIARELVVPFTARTLRNW